ncbi:MAG: type transport system permease protein, partial [Devosia sp.]|nr:type transport system permease protein [Devosia sp.]
SKSFDRPVRAGEFYAPLGPNRAARGFPSGTLSEAFASTIWAGTGALLAAGSPLALAAAILALFVLGLARLLSPKRP